MFKSKSVLYRYLASFISIAMLCCVVIGITGYLLAVSELRSSARQEQHKRLVLAVDDFAAQFDHLEKISHHVMTTACYSPSYFSRNPYYEVELLEDLAKQQDASALFTQCFIRYENDESIFTMAGKTSLNLFTRIPLTDADRAALRTLLDDIESPAFYPMENGTLAIFPMRFTAAEGYSGRATMCFYLPDSALLYRALLISGEKFTRMALHYQDLAAAQIGEINDAYTVDSGAFSMIFDNSELDIGVNSHFLRMSLGFIMFFAIMLCVLAMYIAVVNFRPLANLAKRHNVESGSNEIEYLDKIMTDIKGQLHISREQLNEHVQMFNMLRSDLHRYFSAKLIRGETDEQLLERMREAGMQFPGTFFYAFILRPVEKKNTASPENAIYELTDENSTFYVAPFGGENTYAVIVNTNVISDWEDILSDTCADMNVFGGERTDTLSAIPSLLFDAMTKSSPSVIKPSDIARCREDEHLRKFRKALERGDEADALEYLSKYYSAYEDGDETMRQLIHSNIVSTLLSASYEVNINVPHSFLRGNYGSWTMLEGWISTICNSREKDFSEQEEHQIIRYLRDSALDYQLTLERVAEKFHRSTRQISRIIQNETGSTYKEFVLQMRMEHAKGMLAEGFSVSETCEKVCYVSRSHFIKTFTAYVGMTPSRYRDSIAQQPEKKD